MELSFSRQSLIRVLCEHCLRAKDNSCIICEGTGSYYWDPSSLICFTQRGKLIQIRSENGQIEETHSETLAEDSSFQISEMLNFINRWINTNTERKWKLWVDNSGWHSSLWFNRLKNESCDFSSNSFEECLLWTYEKIL